MDQGRRCVGIALLIARHQTLQIDIRIHARGKALPIMADVEGGRVPCQGGVLGTADPGRPPVVRQKVPAITG
jgi:hypothetical protein